MAAAEKFKAPEAPTIPGDMPSNVNQPITEESDEEEVGVSFFFFLKKYAKSWGIETLKADEEILRICLNVKYMYWIIMQ